MEGVRERLVGDENRDVTGQIDVTRYCCSSSQQFWLIPNGDFRAEETRNCGKLKLKDKGDNIVSLKPHRKEAAW